LCKKFWFPCPTIWSKGASKIVNDTFWSFRPLCHHCQEDIVSSFSGWNTVKSIAYTVRTPTSHDPPS
ncbi:hypothetical protein GYMLUDRAFT_174685, partial [Collybiopsis luxurians FD-317 M1]